MNKFQLYGLVLCGFMHPLNAQITINSSVFPAVGDTLHYVFGNQPGAINQVFTPPGGNQQWDLSALQASHYWDHIIDHPQTGTASASFPAASHRFNPLNSISEVYEQATANNVNDLGYFGSDPLGLGMNLLFIKSPGLELSWAPINFFDIRQSSANVLTAFSALSAPAVLLALVPSADSFRIRITYQRLGVIDAWGALAIPGGTFDVLRKKQTEYRSTAVDVKVAPLGWIDISTIGGQQVLPLGTDTITTFHFLNDLSKETIAVCTLNTAQNAVTGVQYKAVNTTTATVEPSAPDPIFAYPNPVHHTLNVRFPLAANASSTLRLIDARGKVILEHPVPANATGNIESILVSSLAPGMYELLLLRDAVAVGRTRVVKI